MVRRVYCKQYNEWSPDIKTKLRRNNFGRYGGGGMMRHALFYDPMTFVMLDDQELIGWALVSNERITNGRGVYGGRPAMFWVKRRYRRQGVGTKLAKRIQKQYRRLEIEPYDVASENFFEAVGLY
jgi:GNAT superfamily N-acetyltransferase